MLTHCVDNLISNFRGHIIALYFRYMVRLLVNGMRKSLADRLWSYKS